MYSEGNSSDVSNMAEKTATQESTAEFFFKISHFHHKYCTINHKDIQEPQVPQTRQKGCFRISEYWQYVAVAVLGRFFFKISHFPKKYCNSK